MTCSGDFEILHEIVCDTKRKSEKHELVRVVLRIYELFRVAFSKSQLHFISFLTVDKIENIKNRLGYGSEIFNAIVVPYT